MSDAPESFEVGVDIGGTFTDVVCRAPGKPMRVVKLATTRGDPSRAVLDAVRFMVESWDVNAAGIGRFLHGTTIATNAVLERKGARIGLLTSLGFRDVLEIGRVMRQRLYGVILEPETPVFLAPGERRKEVIEQVAADGSVVVALDEESVARAVDELAADGAEAIAVAYIFSFMNPRHELRTREIVAERHPGLMVSLSCEVDPAFREYERTVVTAFDAYMKPVVDRYLGRLEAGLDAAGIPAPLQVMQSRGGLSGAVVARQRPVRLFMSGPAAGVIGGAIVGRMTGRGDLITIDIGGTSSDIALVRNGTPLIRPEGKIGGFPVRVAMVDVNTIGSGGGSLASLDGAGGLRVGPRSAGSEPGPACYGRGGCKPTVTDASLVLGYLDPAYFAGGSLALDPKLAHAAIDEHIARPMGLAVHEAALGIHRVVNSQMAEGVRLVSIRQGIDPRHFTLVALGGAGPLHATALARDIGIRNVIVPRHPGVLAAAGLLAARTLHEVSAAYPRKLASLDPADLRAALDAIDCDCGRLMADERIAPGSCRVSYFVDACYVGQSYTIEVPIRPDAPDVSADFLRLHERIYGYATENPIALVNVRTVHDFGGDDAITDGPYIPAQRDPKKPGRMIRVAAAPSPVPACVYDRAAMPAGMSVEGPAVIEQADTTTLLEPGWRAIVRRDGLLLLDQLP